MFEQIDAIECKIVSNATVEAPQKNSQHTFTTLQMIDDEELALVGGGGAHGGNFL